MGKGYIIYKVGVCKFFFFFFLRGKRGAEFCSFVVAHKTSRGL